MLNVILNSIYSVILAFHNWMKLSWQADKHTNIQSVAEKNTNYHSHTGRDTAKVDQSSNQLDPKQLVLYYWWSSNNFSSYPKNIWYAFCIFLSIFTRYIPDSKLISHFYLQLQPVTFLLPALNGVLTPSGPRELWSQLGFIPTKNIKNIRNDSSPHSHRLALSDQKIY